MKKIETKLKKILELALKGDTNEKETAMRKLNDIAQKYNIEVADLIEEKEKTREFKVNSKIEQSLLFQIISYVLNTVEISYSKWKTRIGVSLKEIEYIEILQLYRHHKRELKRVLEENQKRTITAYYFKQKLYPQIDNTDDETDISPEEAYKIIQMSKDIEYKPYHKQLNK